MGAKLGDRVVYHAHEAHFTETVKTDPSTNEQVTTHGSHMHHECRVFAGQVGRLHGDGTADIIYFPPNREPRWADRVVEGKPEPQPKAVQSKREEGDPGIDTEVRDYFELVSETPAKRERA